MHTFWTVSPDDPSLNDSAEIGEAKLLRAIVRRAVWDAIKGNEAERSEARAWIDSDNSFLDQGVLCCFVDICDFLDINPSIIRNYLTAPIFRITRVRREHYNRRT